MNDMNLQHSGTLQTSTATCPCAYHSTVRSPISRLSASRLMTQSEVALIYPHPYRIHYPHRSPPIDVQLSWLRCPRDSCACHTLSPQTLRHYCRPRRRPLPHCCLIHSSLGARDVTRTPAGPAPESPRSPNCAAPAAGVTSYRRLAGGPVKVGPRRAGAADDPGAGACSRR